MKPRFHGFHSSVRPVPFPKGQIKSGLMGKYWLTVLGARPGSSEFIFSSSSIMVSQPMANENIVILTANGIDFSQADEHKPANQSRSSLRKHLQAEVKVFGVSPVQKVLGWEGGGAKGRNYLCLGNGDPS